MNQALFNRLLNQLEQSPTFSEIQNSPVKKNMYEVLKSGDKNRGESLARNICNSCGVSEQEMYNRASAFFNIK